MSPVRDGLRDTPERKHSIMENDYAALNYTETLDNDEDHIMVNYNYMAKKSQSLSTP